MDPSFSSPSAVAPPVPSIEELQKELQELLYKTDGAMLLAGFISTLLYGVVLHQAYRYIRIFPKDVLLIRLLVPVVLVIETLYTACLIHYCYYDFVTNYANPEQIFEHISWSGNAITTSARQSSVTHIFFIRRVSMLGTYHKWLAAVAVVFHVAQNTFGLIITVRGFIHHNAETYTSQKYLMGLCFGFAVLADMSITGALLGVLYKGRAKQRGDRPLWDTITAYFINTGSLVLILDILSLVLAMATDGNLYWAAVNTINARIYATTLLSVLNSRNIEAADGIEIFSGGPLRSIARARRLAAIQQWNVPEEPDPAPAKIAINVDRKESLYHMDTHGTHNRWSQTKSHDMRYAQVILSTLAVVAAVLASPFPGEAIEARYIPPKEWVAISKTDGHISATEGSPNGLYIVHNETHAAFYGEVSAEQLASAQTGPRGVRLRPDVQRAAERIYYLYNSVYAFGCDSGNEQSTTGSDYWAAYSCVDHNCGTTQSGWDGISDWKVTYGRELGSFGC
ncbi:hypothetical protein C8T65DRAFT_739342 [Cerioporus squamosus]|nr:hypothetical protein C8T65DRAFT_739342 [Cerioporus squamosus]